jgi:hypothetical protein
MRSYDKLRRPALEIGLRRNGEVMLWSYRFNLMWIVIYFIVSAAVMFSFGRAGILVALLTAYSGYRIGISALLIPGYRSSTWLLNTLEPHSEPEGWAQAAEKQRDGRNNLFRFVAFSLSAFLVALLWCLARGGRPWLLVACTTASALLIARYRATGWTSKHFLERTLQARAIGCHISVFRSFNENASSFARNALIPVLSGYGKVDVVVDKTIVETRPTGVFGLQADGAVDSYCTVHRFKDEEWKERVREIIKDTDIALIDTTQLTPGLAWEMIECYWELPPHRVQLMVDARLLKKVSMQSHMADWYAAIESSPHVHDVRPSVFVVLPGMLQQELMVEEMHNMMTYIVHEDERLQLEARQASAHALRV